MNEAFAKALIKAQQEMPAIEKTGKNPHFRSEFVTLDHLLAKTLPVLNDNGIAAMQMPTIHAETGMPMLATTFVHESGESLTFETALFLEKNEPQKHGAAITYARRHALASALGISDEKDDDAETTRSSQASAGGQGVPSTTSEPRASSPPRSLGEGSGPAQPPAEELSEEEKDALFASRWDKHDGPEGTANLKRTVESIEDLSMLLKLKRIEGEREIRTKKKPRKSLVDAIALRISQVERMIAEGDLEGEPSAAAGVASPVAQENEPPPAADATAGQSFNPASPSENDEPDADAGMVAKSPTPDVGGPGNGVIPTVDHLLASLAFIQDQPSSVENANAWTVPGILLGLSQRGVSASSLQEIDQATVEMVWGAIPDEVRGFVGSYLPETLAAEAAKAK